MAEQAFKRKKRRLARRAAAADHSVGTCLGERKPRGSMGPTDAVLLFW